MGSEFVSEFLTEILVGGRIYTVDITIDMDIQPPYEIVVKAHYDGLIVEETYIPVEGEIRPQRAVADCLKVVRKLDIVRMALDSMTAVIGRSGDILS